jgi:hypothetical protein
VSGNAKAATTEAPIRKIRLGAAATVVERRGCLPGESR